MASSTPCTLVVFGASGDLATRKLLPAVGALRERGALADGFALVGVARSDLGDEGWRERCREAAGGDAAFLERCRYVRGSYEDASTFEALAGLLDELDAPGAGRLFYLATPADVFGPVADGLAATGVVDERDGAYRRLVVEKPFGHDLASAQALDADLHRSFREDQLYRIDHYLGKETVQNVLALRFANAIFEPVWNRHYVDHVQVTIAESGGVGGRAGFYDEAGALRDIVQNHALQVVATCAMEPPSSMDPTSVRDEKVKALRSVRPWRVDEVEEHAVRAQYAAGTVDGEAVPGFCEEEGIAEGSTTETFVALELQLDSWRWAGVPWYLRTGKRLARRVTEVALQFKPVPHLPFAAAGARSLHPNVLVLRIQPDEGITLRFGAKVPGQAFELRDQSLDFSYDEAYAGDPPEAYERLLQDAMAGDPTLFIRTDEVEQAWKIVDPVLEAWADRTVPVGRYAAGSWGPKEADRLLAGDGRSWRRL